MNKKTYVGKDERLYRRILSNKYNQKTGDHYTKDKKYGKIEIKDQAFMGGNKPSVFRSDFICNPENVKKEDSNGVIMIEAVDIKSITMENYRADAEIDDPDNNPAHAEIVFVPDIESDENNLSKSKIRRMRGNLRDALARKSICIIDPNPL